jgi:HAMP domain-containing protein
MGQEGQAAKRDAAGAPFPGRLGRSLTLALGAVILLVVLVGGAFFVLAVRIHLNNEAVLREYGHIRRADEIHLLFHDLVFELHQADSSTAATRTAKARLLDGELERHIAELSALNQNELEADENKKKQTLLGELRQLADKKRAITRRLTATKRFADDIHWLDAASQLVPRTVDGLAGPHRSRIERRLESTRNDLRVLVFLYAAFIVAGGALLAAASSAANRRIAAPLRKLSEAAREIAEGGVGVRVGARLQFCAETERL